MTTITRFAPSPTGLLHVGNLRTALHNWLLSQKASGKFLLRIDDTDAERSEEAFVEAAREDLAWLGIEPDGEERQSERFALYDAAFDKLREMGRVYPCYESAQELELKRKIQLGRGLPPIYDRGALALSDEERAAKEAGGVQPHWRFKLDHDEAIAWDDGIRGPVKFDPAQLSDPVIRRGDGSWLYMLPSAVDDIEMGVTDVLRGEDHVSNTAAQVQMFAALGADSPRFAHEALLVGKEGKLSKRLGSLSARALRERGLEPEALLSLLARLGTSMPVEAIVRREVLVESFDLSTFSRAPAKFDEAELNRLNAQIVHRLPYTHVSDRLPDGMDEKGWGAIRPNLSRVDEAEELWSVVTGAIIAPRFSDEDRAYLSQAVSTAEEMAWDDDPWHALTGALKEMTGRKGRALFLPLRQALTGVDAGPDMGALLPLIGRDTALERLRLAAK